MRIYSCGRSAGSGRRLVLYPHALLVQSLKTLGFTTKARTAFFELHKREIAARDNTELRVAPEHFPGQSISGKVSKELQVPVARYIPASSTFTTEFASRTPSTPVPVAVSTLLTALRGDHNTTQAIIERASESKLRF